jgi:16S rRNA (cytosine967-C5)-methyltransferase
MKNNARYAALQVLIDFRLRPDSFREKKIYDRIQGLPPQEKALAVQLVYGVLQNYYKLDACIRLVSKAGKIQPQARDILRLGIYQLLFLDKIPKSAAVNESVKLAKHINMHTAAQSFINAILRNISKWDSPPVFNELWEEYSHPEWLVELLGEEFGFERTKEILKFNNTAPPAYIQVLKPEYRDKLLAAGAEEHPDGCLTYRGSVGGLPGYNEGAFIIADNAARLAVEIAAPRRGERVLDACAAPGGKSVMLYNMSQISLVCCDKYPFKIVELKETLAKHGMDGVECMTADAREFKPEFESAFDLVLADVPCSGLGVIRKKPDIRYKNSEHMSLVRTQRDILDNLARYVALNGRLVYVTCTVLKRENQNIIQGFLESHPEFELQAFDTPFGNAPDGMFITPFAERDIDGFFYAKMGREKRL